MRDEELMQQAVEARKLSYSPYSNFKVGAALLCKARVNNIVHQDEINRKHE